MAFLFHAAYTIGACEWDGRQQCDVYRRRSYRRLFAIMLAATVTSYVCFTALRIAPAYSRTQLILHTQVAIHCIALVCDAAAITLTALQAVATADSSRAGSEARLAQEALQSFLPFILLSACFSLFFFTVTVLDLWQTWRCSPAVAPASITVGEREQADVYGSHQLSELLACYSRCRSI